MNITMWTAATRAQHTRDGLRFASDLTDAEVGPGAAAATSVDDGTAAGLAVARTRQRHVLRPARRYPVAYVAALLPAPTDRLWLVCRVARRRCVAVD